MRTIVLAAGIGLLWSGALEAAAGAGPAAAENDNARRAAEGLKRTADHLIVTPDAPRRAARLVALCRAILTLRPRDAETHRILAEVIYPSQGRRRLAVGALEAYLAARPADHQAAVRWLDLTLSARNTAEARLEHLAAVGADASRSAPLRAEAQARRGQVLLGRGLKDRAAQAFARALGLDGGNAAALAGRLALTPNPAARDRVEALLADLKANAGRAATANELADLLQAKGLHARAIVLYRHLSALADQPGSTSQARHLTAVRLYNAMLDNAQAADVTEALPALLRVFGSSVDLRALLAEAWRAEGNAREAEKQITAIASVYGAAHDSGRVSTAMAAELAMFYLVTRPDIGCAREYADQVAREAKDDPVAQRLLGRCEIAAGKPETLQAGLKRLRGILDRDLYAAVFLAEHHFATGSRDAGVEALRAGMRLPRGGPACRKLLALAKRHRVPVAPVPGSGRIAEMVERAGTACLDMAVTPEKFIRVTIAAAGMKPAGAARLAPGEPVKVTLTLANIATVPVPIGKRGLLAPAVALDVTAEAPRTDKKHFTDLPLCVWPAPRYLRPGQTLQATARLDVGSLGRLLAETPLTELALTVNATVSPVRPFGRVVSGLPLKVRPLRIVRTDAISHFDRRAEATWPERYRYALGMIVRDMKRGTLAQRIRAARQVAALLALARGIERGTAKAPEPLRGRVTKPVLLTMAREVMKDPGYAVRAEMIASLIDVPIDKHLKGLLPAAAGDPHPLVRFRLAELLAAARPAGVKPLRAALAKDSDALVRLMMRAARP